MILNGTPGARIKTWGTVTGRYQTVHGIENDKSIELLMLQKYNGMHSVHLETKKVRPQPYISNQIIDVQRNIFF